MKITLAAVQFWEAPLYEHRDRFFETARSAPALSLLVAALFFGTSCGEDAPPWTVLGPEGGVVQGPDGVELTVPPGALSEETRLRIRRVTAETEGFLALSPVYVFEPLGQVFDLPVVMRVPYDTESAGDATRIWMWSSPAVAARWTAIYGEVDPALGTVSASAVELVLAAVGTPDASCVPDCEGRECGPDGCGGGCLPGCAGLDHICDELSGECYCEPDCQGRECGPDGCGGLCGPGCSEGACLEGPGLCTICGDGVCDFGENSSNCSSDCPATDLVDILFVVDNSTGSASLQQWLAEDFYGVLLALDATPFSLPSLHVGVVSTDLGSGDQTVGSCDDQGGDKGALFTAGATELETVPYLVDEPPSGCHVQRDADGFCTGHDCSQADCGDGTLVEDPRTGCPRCRNHVDTVALFERLATMGGGACEFVQPLESMRLALDNHPDNAGFLRPGSVLVVLLVTDEDDCSAADNLLFDGSDTALDSPLGPLTDFRCFEFGVTCDTQDRTEIGTWDNCAPSTDASALLYPAARYTGFLEGLRDPGRLVVGAITGPVVGDSVDVGTDQQSRPEVEISCVYSGTVRGRPAIRIRWFVRELSPPGQEQVYSVCDPTYYNHLYSLGERIRVALQ